MSRSPSRSRSPSVSRKREKSRSRSYSRSPSRSRSRSRSERRDDRRRENDRSDRGNRYDDEKPHRVESTSVLVRKINYRTTSEDLKKQFAEFGEVTDVYIPLDYHSRRPRGFAFVKFANRDDAEASIKALDGTEIDGSRVEVVLAQESRKSPRTMRQMSRGSRHGGRRDDRDYDDRRRGGYGYRDSRRRSRSRSRSYSRGREDRRDRRY